MLNEGLAKTFANREDQNRKCAILMHGSVKPPLVLKSSPSTGSRHRLQPRLMDGANRSTRKSDLECVVGSARARIAAMVDLKRG